LAEQIAAKDKALLDLKKKIRQLQKDKRDQLTEYETKVADLESQLQEALAERTPTPPPRNQARLKCTSCPRIQQELERARGELLVLRAAPPPVSGASSIEHAHVLFLSSQLERLQRENTEQQLRLHEADRKIAGLEGQLAIFKGFCGAGLFTKPA
jgi:hypothetical protein